jgi:hypothetical protein
MFLLSHQTTEKRGMACSETSLIWLPLSLPLAFRIRFIGLQSQSLLPLFDEVKITVNETY